MAVNHALAMISARTRGESPPVCRSSNSHREVVGHSKYMWNLATPGMDLVAPFPYSRPCGFRRRSSNHFRSRVQTTCSRREGSFACGLDTARV
jgi:hypothetical protein